LGKRDKLWTAEFSAGMGAIAGAWLAGCSFILPAKGHWQLPQNTTNQSRIVHTSGSIIIELTFLWLQRGA
jgi:hypothetical protein